MSAKSVTVRIPSSPEDSYEVVIGSGILDTVLSDIERTVGGLRPFVVTDSNLENAGHLRALTGDTDTDVFVIDPAGEQSKTMATVEDIVGEMEQKSFGRDSVVIALGGGTVGDIAGFAASIFKRGVRCVQVPTSTVAQADSSVGGKVGVDSKLSKNAYGAFHHPARVYMDCSVLRTLDDRHYRAGLVETVKHAMIADPEFLDMIECRMDDILGMDEAVLEQLAERNTAIKGRVVCEDPYEKALRRVLNFGHTIGHAVESVSGFSLLHGEAVAVGIIGACRIAERHGVSSAGVGERAETVLEKLGMTLKLPDGIKTEELIETMKRDKKASGGNPRYVLLKDIGAVAEAGGDYAAEVPLETIEEVIRELQEGKHVQT